MVAGHRHDNHRRLRAAAQQAGPQTTAANAGYRDAVPPQQYDQYEAYASQAPNSYPASASQNASSPMPDDIRERFEQQDREIRRLQAQLEEGKSATPATPTAFADPNAAPAAPAGPAGLPPGSSVVGSDLSVKTSFKDGLFLWLETPNKDFTMHLGGVDAMGQCLVASVPGHVGQSRRTRPRNRPSPGGVTSGGIGDLEDGEYFRRIRPFAEGTFWETGEYRLILALENNQFSTAGLDEFWVGETHIPVIGTVRVGHVKDPMGWKAI